MTRDVSRASSAGPVTAFFFCCAALLMSAASQSQSIPPGDGWQVKLSNGTTVNFGGIAAKLCATPNAFIPASRTRFSKETTINDQGKEIAASFMIYAPFVAGPVITLTSLELPLLQGDRELVYACGCVHIGGKGKTWKSYVHPIGPKSDHLYSGTIQFLTGSVTANFLGNPTGMKKIADLVSTQGNGFTVPNDITALALGYLDDHFDDNDYNNHDDGDDNQCKNVGPAALEIAIFHAR